MLFRSEDDEKAMSHEADEASWRLRAGVVAFGGTIAEMAGVGLEKMGKISFRFGRQFGFLGETLGKVGRFAGIAGAVLMAGFDGWNFYKNLRDGNTGIAFLYLSSAVVGGLIVGALLLSWTGIGILLVAILIAISILIEIFKNNKVQDWLERCVWGKNSKDRYQTLDQERQQFKLAIAG